MLSALTKLSSEVFWGQAAVWLRTAVIVVSYGFGQGPYLWTFLWGRSGKHDSWVLAGNSKTWACLMVERVNWHRCRPMLSKSCVYVNVSLINQMCVNQLALLCTKRRGVHDSTHFYTLKLYILLISTVNNMYMCCAWKIRWLLVDFISPNDCVIWLQFLDVRNSWIRGPQGLKVHIVFISI